MIRKQAPKIDERKFATLIRRGSMPSAKTRQNAPTRATLLLRLDPDLLKQIDTLVEKTRLDRHTWIVQMLERVAKRSR